MGGEYVHGQSDTGIRRKSWGQQGSTPISTSEGKLSSRNVKEVTSHGVSKATIDKDKKEEAVEDSKQLEDGEESSNGDSDHGNNGDDINKNCEEDEGGLDYNILHVSQAGDLSPR